MYIFYIDEDIIAVVTTLRVSLCLSLCSLSVSLPILLVVVHRHSTGTVCHNQQKTADDRQRLKEIVFQIVPVERSDRRGPESIVPAVHGEEPDDEYQRAQFRSESDGNKQNEHKINGRLEIGDR